MTRTLNAAIGLFHCADGDLQRTLAEQNSREEEIRHILNSVPAEIAVLSASGPVELSNRLFTERIGSTPEQVASIVDWWKTATSSAFQVASHKPQRSGEFRKRVVSDSGRRSDEAEKSRRENCTLRMFLLIWQPW